MWGAGQMMFNKILVLADEQVKIQDYEALAKYIFRNLNPATDVYFSQGPMDVLDHSCSKLGFGGKMCIDGTRKFEQEKEEEWQWTAGDTQLDDLLKAKFSEVHSVNKKLLLNEIPVLVVSVEKNRKGHLRELHQQICELAEIESVKMVLYVEHTVDANDLAVALWRFCNNLDPKRDYNLVQRPSKNNLSKNFACLGLDGTIKTKELDNFQRDWPNFIVSNDETFRSVDNKWERLGLGEFIPSPSLKFKDQMYGEEAVAN
ncbi:MAG TPA: menaquinone biosynthesis decarboxylase, partial [Flavisolibacter sp.]